MKHSPFVALHFIPLGPKAQQAVTRLQKLEDAARHDYNDGQKRTMIGDELAYGAKSATSTGPRQMKTKRSRYCDSRPAALRA